VAVGAERVQEPVLSGPVTTSMNAEELAAAQIACSLDNPDACEMCSG
jgi:hypothetical protein